MPDERKETLFSADKPDLSGLKEFKLNVDRWATYVSRMKAWFEIQNVSPKQYPKYLVAVVGTDAVDLIIDLVYPDKPEDMSFEVIVKLVEEHLSPKRSLIAERILFRSCKQYEGQSITDYLVQLKKLSKPCKFGNNESLKENLRDQFVYGLSNERIRQRLLVEDELTFGRATELALSLEAAVRDSRTGGNGDGEVAAAGLHRGEAVYSMREDSSGTSRRRAQPRGGDAGGSEGRPRAYVQGGEGRARRSGAWRGRGAGPRLPRCYRCDGRHPVERCPFLNSECYVCGDRGHLAKMCRFRKHKEVHQVNRENEDVDESSFETDGDEICVYQLSDGEDERWNVAVNVNGIDLMMEGDTGSSISIISYGTYKQYFNCYKLMPHKSCLKMYSGQRLKPKGQLLCTVTANGRTLKELPLMVIDNEFSPSLLGRNWMRALGIVLPVISPINNIDTIVPSSDDIKNRFSKAYPQVFATGIGTFNKAVIKLEVEADARPVWRRARPVPFALRPGVEAELARLQREGIITPVDWSDWGTPVVPVIKKSGNPRNKCALPPGHSLMDWIRLGNSGKDLTGVGGRIRPVSPRELALHNTKNDVWLAIRGRVYNITHYLPFHPGGQEELMRGAGIDATQLFDKVHPWVNYDSLLAKCLVGPLCIDRPDSEELFGSPNPSPKFDRLREPSKTQELVRKSMENLANCITPVKKKISSKSEDNVKPGNPSKIMQSLIMSSDLPVSISRRAGSSSPVRSKSSSGDDTPSPLRFDWIQTSVKLMISIYAGSLSNPGGCARLTEGALLIEIVTNEWLRTLKIVPEAKLKGPLQIKVYVECGKVEVTAQKADTSVWKSCGDTTASAATRVSSPRTVPCWVRSQRRVTHDTAILGLAPEPGPVVVPLGYHVRIHCNVDGNKCVRSYTPVGEGWSAEPAEVNASIKLAVKRYPDGALSKHLTALSVDDVVTLSGPYGNFQLQKLKGVSQIYFIAAGTGITPMLGLIRFMLTRSNPKCEKGHLLFFNKKEEDILFHENFKEIAKGDDRFKATHVLSEATSTWTGHTGRINSDLLSDMLGKSFKCVNQCNHFVCLCGPTEFTHTGLQLLKALGVQENCLHAFMG